MLSNININVRRACKCAVATLQDGSAALDAVETSIVALEDDWCLNAGKYAFVFILLLSHTRNPRLRFQLDYRWHR